MFDKIKIPKIKLGGAKSVDECLIQKGRLGYFIATLDKAIKRAVHNRIVIFDAQNRIGAE